VQVRREVQTDETLPLAQAVPLAVQHLMAMFGATVLVPILTGLDPGIGLMTSGVGTLLYLALTRGQIPSYLGSSFAFIAPLIVVGGGPGGPNIPYALGGLVAAGVVYVVVAAIVKAFGTAWLYHLLPPALIGAVVIVIGLSLAGVAVNMALYGNGAAPPGTPINAQYLLLATVTLAACIVFAGLGRGFAATVPVLLGVLVGYGAAAVAGQVNFQPVADAAWLDVPWHHFTYPRFEPLAVLIIAPVALVVVVEHIGHLLVINEITHRDFMPLLPESLAGDGIATAVSALVGGTPSTTYAENIGVMAVTRVYAVQVFWYAGALALLIGGFVPKVGAVISSIPTPVMGGVSILLFGLIASAGLRMLVESGVDYSQTRNLLVSSVVLVIGVGNLALKFGDYEVPALALATVVGVGLNLALPRPAAEAPVAET
jgi:uracil-xanthine permease